MLPFFDALLDAFFIAYSFYRGAVGHGAVPFQLFDILPELVLQFFGNLHHPVYDAEQVNYALLVTVAFVKQFCEPPFCRKPLAVVAFGLSGEQVGGSYQGKRVVIREQRFGLWFVVQQFDCGKFQARLPRCARDDGVGR